MAFYNVINPSNVVTSTSDKYVYEQILWTVAKPDWLNRMNETIPSLVYFGWSFSLSLSVSIIYEKHTENTTQIAHNDVLIRPWVPTEEYSIVNALLLVRISPLIDHFVDVL